MILTSKPILVRNERVLRSFSHTTYLTVLGQTHDWRIDPVTNKCAGFGSPSTDFFIIWFIV